MGLAASLALYFGTDKIRVPDIEPKSDAAGIVAQWATLVFDGQSIDWIGDPKILEAAKAKKVRVAFINKSDETLGQLALKPMIDAIGAPAIVFQSSDGKVVKLAHCKTVAEVVSQFDLINP